MSVALLDVNVLFALLWPGHQFHTKAAHWFKLNRATGWATCPVTQTGFVRIFSQGGIIGRDVSVQDALGLLEENCQDNAHQFWAINKPLPGLLPDIRARLFGHQQLTDAVLLDLAIREGGRLVTFDRKIPNLLPRNSPHLSAIEILLND